MDISDLKILIVDDEESICEILETILSIKNITSKSVRSGNKALEEINKSDYNIIFLDHFLPDITGLNILKKSLFSKRNCYVVFMTGDFQKNMLKELVALGVNEILLKPFNFNEVINIIERALSYLTGYLNFNEAVDKIVFSEIDMETGYNPSIIKSISVILARNVCEAGFFEDEMQVILALNEVIANAMFHGNLEIESKLKEESLEKFFEEAEKRSKLSPYKERKVYIHGNFDKKSFKVVVRDQGKGFQWQKYHFNFNSGKILPHGRGLMIVLSIFDKVKWNDKGNEITLIKYKTS